MSRVTLCVVLLTIVFAQSASAQASRELAVMLSATVNGGATPSITLQWDIHPEGGEIQITRKLKTEAAWSNIPTAALDSTASNWTDINVEIGKAYDYRVIRYIRRFADRDSNWYGTGYISSGINVLPQRRTRVLIVVDSTMWNGLTSQLNILRADLEAEGWAVTIVGSPRAETFDAAKVESTRAIIRAQTTPSRNDLGAILLIGRVPVLYSGAGRIGTVVFAPDGHPDHIGAWPADAIYGDLDGVYTDVTENWTNTSRPVQSNIPGDGKYDQTLFPSDIDVPVGRIDFYNMPAFTEAAVNPISEIDLVRNYLTRNHAYRTTSPVIRIGGIIDDNFQGAKDGFAAAAWRSFSVFAGDTAVKAGDFFGTLATPPTYLFAYGCGGGNDEGASGVGSTTDMVTKPVNAVFTFLFGSYFGDWDTRNNFLRSSLASKPSALTCAWSGRPHWYTFHMGLGETMGYSTRITQNATASNGFWPMLYFRPGTGGQLFTYSQFDKMNHIALLGDPTLRAEMKPVAAVSTVTATTEYPNKVRLNWVRPAGDVDAYVVLRRRGINPDFALRTLTPITETTFVDSTRFEGDMEYMVQAVALRSTASGTFYDYGKTATTLVRTTSIAEGITGPTTPTLVAAPNPAESDVAFTVAIDANQGVVKKFTLSVFDMLGRTVWSFEQTDILPGRFNVGLNVSTFAVGTYTVRLTTDGTTTTTPLTVAR